MSWGHLKPKTPENGYINDMHITFREFNVIYKVFEKFYKKKMTLDQVKLLRKKDGFRYANVFDVESRKQIASMTKTGSKWFVKYYKGVLVKFFKP